MAKIKGTPEDDFLEGTTTADVIRGLAGDDTIVGLDGNDRLYGGDGIDFVFGGNDDDQLYGEAGDDTLRGDAGNDQLFGGEGDDLMRGADGVDRFDGGAGIDRVSFYLASATQGVIADLRTQTIANDGYGNAETMLSIEGLGGGTVFADTLDGNDLDNLLFASRGDTARGYAGADGFQIEDFGGGFVDGGDGVDSVVFTGYSAFVSGGVITSVDAERGLVVDLGRGRVTEDGFGGRGTLRNVEDVSASQLGDRITGSAVANSLAGQGGDDSLNGVAGDDILAGGAGADGLTGGDGLDIFAFDSADWSADAVETDLIRDFDRGEGDLIQLVNGIEGDPTATRFTFIGTAAFSGAAGEARYAIKGDNTFVYLETDGTAGTDHVIKLTGAIDLTAADFIL